MIPHQARGACLALLLLAAACQREAGSPADSGAAGAAHVHPKRWTCSMHPAYVTDKPGDCPICHMRLVPVVEEAEPAASKLLDGLSTVNIDPERRRLIGLKTVEVKRGSLVSSIRTVGRVTVDETRVVRVQPRFEGYVEELQADFTGRFVKKGERLASIYSPELLATQQEHLLALRGAGPLARAGLPDATDASRARLRFFGISEEQIAEIEKSGTPLRALGISAPISGLITAKNVALGAKVGPENVLFEITDLSRVWVLADVYEYELPRLKVGQGATITLSYWPGRAWKGRVGYIFPSVDDKTRTVRARVEVLNPRLEMKPEMFADVVLEATPRKALLVPDDAVLDSGTRKIVFVALGDGRLSPREIETGERSGGNTEVKSGLQAGERVATGANFLLDSESRLKSALGAMAPGSTSDGGAP